MNGFLQILIFLVVFLIVIAVICYCVRIVPQAKAYVVERLGAYHSTWHTGPHFMVPFIDRVANKVSLKEIVKDFDPQPVITKDNVTMQIDTVVYFQITDPKLYTYGVERPISALENLTATTSRTSSRRATSRNQWRSRCGRNGNVVKRSCVPKVKRNRQS